VYVLDGARGKRQHRIGARVFATIPDFRPHDLRRTASTPMAEIGILPAHISKVVNHIEGGPRATQTYNRYVYDAEKRTALTAWDALRRKILTDKPADVLPFVAKRG
jgi:integrase